MPYTIADDIGGALQDEYQRQIANDAMAGGEQPDPERAARVLSVRNLTGLPEKAIEADLEGLESQLQAQQFN